MKTRLWLIVVVSLLVSASLGGAEDVAGLPLHMQKLDEGTIRLWLGDHGTSTAIVAFATEKGIVVVDTFGIPEVDTRLREAIAREFRRSDFTHLINTHEHRDHTGGNSVYADCTIVGHELVAAGLEQDAGNRERLLEFYPGWIAELEAELEGAEAGSQEAARLEEDLILRRMNFAYLKAGLTPLLPTVTFSDRMTLDMVDTTFDLSFIGGMHTASDIAVFVPERGLLLTGDTMADVWLTDTPGCLASFSVRAGIPHDFPLWLANWDRLLAERDRITTLLPAHWNGELSIDGAEARVEYVRALWQGVSEGAAEGKSLDEVQAEYRLAARFPDLVESPGFDPQRHYASVSEMWAVESGQESAARALYALIEDGADDAAIREVIANRDSDSPAYFFVEAEINGYGYVFLQRDMVEEAIALFRINVQLHPDSWNCYDSLGEALLLADDTDEAVAMYEKSLVLNPDNDNGREVLARLNGGA